MKSSAPLSPAARDLLDLGSIVAPPTSEQHARMDRAIARLRALDGAGPPPVGSTNPVRMLGASAGVGKLALVLGALAATAGASFWMGRASVPPEPMRVEEAATASSAASFQFALEQPTEPRPDSALGSPTLNAPTLNAPTLNAPTLNDQVPNAPASNAPTSPEPAPAPARGSPPVAAGTATPVSLGAVLPSARPRAHAAPPARRSAEGLAGEIERMARAEAALRQGQPRTALHELETSTRFLREQAKALQAIAECQLDQKAALPSARQVLQHWPTSAFAPRIRAACQL